MNRLFCVSHYMLIKLNLVISMLKLSSSNDVIYSGDRALASVVQNLGDTSTSDYKVARSAPQQQQQASNFAQVLSLHR